MMRMMMVVMRIEGMRVFRVNRRLATSLHWLPAWLARRQRVTSVWSFVLMAPLGRGITCSGTEPQPASSAVAPTAATATAPAAVAGGVRLPGQPPPRAPNAQ
jgi:hypothetical protein